jgi:hypothetical protein
MAKHAAPAVADLLERAAVAQEMLNAIPELSTSTERLRSRGN